MENVDKFDIDSIKTEQNVFILGFRFCGKTELCNHILKKFDNKYRKIVVCGTEDNYTFKRYTDENCIHMVYNETIFKTILDEQQKFIKENPDSHTILCLDDVAHHQKIYNGDDIYNIFRMSEILKISVIMTSSSIHCIPHRIVDNFNYIFSFESCSITEKKILYFRYFNKMHPFSFFNDTITKITQEKYTTLVIDKTKLSTNLRDCVYSYKIDAVENV